MNQNYYSDSIAHHGVKGQRWGVRRYQNEDGSLTNRGKQKKEKKELTPEQQAAKKAKIKRAAKIIGITSAVAVPTIATGVAVKAGRDWLSNLCENDGVGALGLMLFLGALGQ